MRPPLIKNLPVEFQIKKGQRVHVYGKLKGAEWKKIYTAESVKKAHAYISKVTHYQKPKRAEAKNV